jgi:lipoate-protein ligase A
MTAARLILDPPAGGAWNMAVDEALLESAALTGQSTLRFYAWQDATLSLGYFQNYAARKTHAASHELPLVRRATGGGAIVHHHELTYSFASPITDRLAADVEQLYYTFHETLIDALSIFGIRAQLCDRPVKHDAEAAPFLCFQRRAKGDVLCGGAKIAGSAQRRRHGAVLQHGSVLLCTSPQSPELRSIAEVGERVLTPGELIRAWEPLLASKMSVSWALAELTSAEMARAAEVEQAKFSADSWNQRR